MPNGWIWKEPGAPGWEVHLLNTESSFIFDVTWMGIRKGGRRFYALKNSSIVHVHTPEVVGPDYTLTLANDPVIVNPFPRGLTNNKKHFVSTVWDLTSATTDTLQYNDLQGRFIKGFQFSDGPIKKSRALVYLNHDFYVLQDGSNDPVASGLRVYDGRGKLIRIIALPNGVFAKGITTDGKDLYLINTAGAGAGTILKIDVRGNVVDTHPIGVSTETEVTRWPLTFNGRYLLLNVFEGGPG